MKCKFEHDGHCCNCGATQYMIECKQPCETIVPMTKADRIRAMSDEELAELLVEEKEYGVCHIPFFRCPGGKDFDEDQYEDALRYTIDWLKQPAEGDVNNG